MGVLVWVMMGLAVWHFTVFLPDRFKAGIVGAFVGACVGAIAFGLAIHAFDVPGTDDTDILTAVEALPGVAIGLAIAWFLGVRDEKLAEAHRGSVQPRS